MRLFRHITSHIQYKIILPFVILALLVVISGVAVVVFLITSSAQERFNNQVVQAARNISESIVAQEQNNLLYLREMAFAPENTNVNVPAVSEIMSNGNVEQLNAALTPYFDYAQLRPNLRIDRLIAFDKTQRSVIDWEYRIDSSGNRSRIEYAPRDLSTLWFTNLILQGQSDEVGDKYAGLLSLQDELDAVVSADSDNSYMFTVVPVVHNEQVVGGLLIGTRLDTLLQGLSATAQMASVTVYEADSGQAFATTAQLAQGLSELSIQPSLLPRVRDMELAKEQSVLDTVTINGRDYQLSYAPLRIRGALVGVISAGLSRDYVIVPWQEYIPQLLGLTLVLILLISGMGLVISRQITKPVHELVETAHAVTGGDLKRRSTSKSSDEIGVLSYAFNDMTEHLFNSYLKVHAESSQRAAIVESITDGIVVCDPQGNIQLMNRAMRELLGLNETTSEPQHYKDIPIEQIVDSASAFGNIGSGNMYTLRDHIVRVSSAPVAGSDGISIGDVYVFQDLTNEVAIDRAKTNFIATISHELRTPLTVLYGNADLLLRGYLGAINDDQRGLIDTMRKHALSMTSLVNNVITIANLESGDITIDPEEVSLASLIEEISWTYKKQLEAKNLQLKIDIPDILPNIFADVYQLKNVILQLLDNARRYTDSGTITISAEKVDTFVQLNISDTGQGIDEELSQQLFTRFTRGSEGINSAERGIGLGLSIARQLIELQGGEVWLSHTSDQGSTFSIKVPCVHEKSIDSAIATAA
jgi:signal transduction histidine kinase